MRALSLLLLLFLGACIHNDRPLIVFGKDYSKPESVSSTSQNHSGGKVRCLNTEQVGCLEIDILVITYDRTVPEIEEIIVQDSSRGRGGEELASKLYAAVKEKRAKLHEQCLPTRLVFWGVDNTMPTALMREYQGGGIPVEKPLKSVAAKSFIESNMFSALKAGEPTVAGYEYQLEVCGGRGALQVPWEFFKEQAYFLAQPNAPHIIFPIRKPGGEHQASWVYLDQVEKFKKGKKTWMILAFVMPDSSTIKSGGGFR